MIHQKRIDGGAGFDWGRTAEEYAKYRDIYPLEFWKPLLDAGLFHEGTRVLDIGTGTGVLPRALCYTGARFVGTDISPEQIEQAKHLSQGMPVEYFVCAAEQLDFPAASFDAVTACQCFFYFDHNIVVPRLASILKPGGRLAITWLAWLPAEDKIAGASEQLVLRYNPHWSGAGEYRRPVTLPPVLSKYFRCEQEGQFDLLLPFTRETWAGRIHACRGVGASLPPKVLARFESEHRSLLEEIAPERFEILHYAAYAILRVC